MGFLLCAGWLAALLPLGGSLSRPRAGAPPPAATSLQASAAALLDAGSPPRLSRSSAAGPRRVSRAERKAIAALRRLTAPGRFPYYPVAQRLAARHSVEFRLVMAIIASESGGDPEAVSPAGAVGLMQLMPDTAAKLGVDPLDPEQNLDGAIRYLGSLMSSFRSVDLSLIAYNAGPGFAAKYRAGEVELGAETRAFLIRISKLLD